ncbi:hypothetical protein Ancab_010351 [Ancistrocladus abbreviatus]
MPSQHQGWKRLKCSIAAKQGESEILKVLIEAQPDLSMSYDASNTIASQTAATQGHKEVVNFFLRVSHSNREQSKEEDDGNLKQAHVVGLCANLRGILGIVIYHGG